MQVNYFSSFLLTSLLLPLLKASAPSRIINVSSIVHFYGRTDLNNLNTEYSGIFNSHIVYATAKLCLLQMTMELNRRYKFTGLTAYALHPGVVNTEMVQHLNSWFIRNVLKIFQTFHKTPWEGAQTTIYLAVSPEINKSGFFFKDCREARSSRAVQDLESATKLWELSERYVNLK
ncbi:putative RDH13 [Danaus plexippus plexippus]|uniref:RDH13 n=1 Tax=Danaus plexippus plexippus TaxID=278856 RepID=A0A212F5B2_DANPL|nr:putative RDH13 [Danaus plexippus plexippus]